MANYLIKTISLILIDKNKKTWKIYIRLQKFKRINRRKIKLSPKSKQS